MNLSIFQHHHHRFSSKISISISDEEHDSGEREEQGGGGAAGAAAVVVREGTERARTGGDEAANGPTAIPPRAGRPHLRVRTPKHPVD